MVKLVNVKDLDAYYQILHEMIQNSSMWRSLYRKYDHNCSQNEMYYQETAMEEAGKLADYLGFNRYLTEVLSMCKASFFPMHGKEGFEAILEYLKDAGIDMPIGSLATDFVETEIVRNGGVIAPDFDEALRELFGEKADISHPEVNVVRMCEKTVEDVKTVERHMSSPVKHLLEKAFEDMENCTKELNSLSCSNKLNEMVGIIPNTDIETSNNNGSLKINRIKALVKANDYDTKKALFSFLRDTLDDYEEEKENG